MNARAHSTTQAAGKAKVYTNFWLVTLAIIIGLTVLSTAVLVGWPIIAHLASKFMG